MENYYLGLIILLIANYYLIKLKGIRIFNKYLFFPFFTIAFIAFLFDANNTYKNIPSSGVFMVYVNIILFCLLLFFMILMDQKWKKKIILSPNTEKLVAISKFLTVINLAITTYFLLTLSKTSNIPILELYLKHPYYLELNFSSNAILGNILKTNFLILILMVALKLSGTKFKNFRVYLFLSIVILLAPNRKGELVLAILACTHLYIFYQNVNILKLLKALFFIFAGVILVFTFSYSFYKTAGVELSIVDKIYTYLTYPIAGTAFLENTSQNSIIEYQSLSSIFNKLNILEANNIAIHSKINYINNVPIGNVEGIFSPFYNDLGFLGSIIFIMFLVIFFNFIDQLNKNVLYMAFFTAIISFLDLALFGNYFTNTLFIEVVASVGLIQVLYFFKIPIIKFKWKKHPV